MLLETPAKLRGRVARARFEPGADPYRVPGGREAKRETSPELSGPAEERDRPKRRHEQRSIRSLRLLLASVLPLRTSIRMVLGWRPMAVGGSTSSDTARRCTVAAVRGRSGARI